MEITVEARVHIDIEVPDELDGDEEAVEGFIEQIMGDGSFFSFNANTNQTAINCVEMQEWEEY